MTVCPELADDLLIAEAVLGLPAELIADVNRIGLADSAPAAPQAGLGGAQACNHVIRGIASGDVSEAAFRDWIALRCG